MSKHTPLPIWYRFLIDDLVALRGMNHPDDIHYSACRVDGYIGGLLMTGTVTDEQADLLREVLDSAEQYATAQINPQAVSVHAIPLNQTPRILDLAENIRDHLDALETEITFLNSNHVISTKPLDELALLISIEVDNICCTCLPTPQIELPLGQVVT